MPEYRLTLYRCTWCAYWREADGPRRRSLGTADKKEAERLLNVFAQAQAKIPVTVQTLWDRHAAALAGRPSARNFAHSWRFMAPHFGHHDPREIPASVVGGYTEARLLAGRSNGTIWTELGYLRSALARGVKDGLIERASYIKRPAAPPPRDAYLTRNQFDAFLEGCRLPHARLFALLAITTGARAGAILDLTWDRVDFERGLIELKTDRRPKAKGRATVPMNGSARAALQEARGGALTAFVIEWAGARIKSPKRAMGKAGERSGLTWVTPHVFRHSAAVWMAEDGVPMSEIAAYLGHSDSRITERVYVKYTPGYLRKAAGSLEVGPFARKARNGGRYRD